METQEVRERAAALGLGYPVAARKATLIHAIQRRLGQAVCFASDRRYLCGESDCEWRADCLKPIAEWLR